MAAKKTKTKTPSKKKPAPSPVNKSAFIRQHPDLSTADLIALAKKQGVELTSNFVYTLRSSDRHKEAPKASGGDVGDRRAPKPSAASLDAFIDLVLEHGSRGAAELLGQAVAALRAGAKKK